MLTAESAYRKDARTGKADMQHRHFSTVAAIIKEYPTPATRKAVALHFADSLGVTNPRFDRKRFLTACGVA